MESTSKPSSKSYLFDIEADGLLDTISKIWCISIKDLSTGVNTLYGPDQIQEGLKVLSQADYLLAHNSIDFDFRALKKVTGWEPKKGAVLRDSLVWSKLTHLALDAEDRESKKAAIQELKGSHSLKSWGIRLGCHKGDYTGGWDAYTPEMGAYCQQDVEVLHELFKHLKQQWYTEEALELEHKARWRSVQMTERGFAFDVERANKLHEEIKSTLQGLEEKAKSLVDPVVSYEQQKKPAYWEVKVLSTGEVLRRKTRGECDQWRKDNKIKPKDCEFVAGPPGQKEIITHFNPGSRKQVSKYLFDRYGWVSPELTEKGEKLIGRLAPFELAKQYGKLSEEVLRDLSWEDGQLFADIFLIKKAGSFLRSQKETGWLLDVSNGRIHHSMDTLGCVTSRCSHRNPNLGQVPSVEMSKEGEVLWGVQGRYGADSRSLFGVSEGYVLIGTDESGIESRNLAHYLAPYDQGAYIKEVLSGDIHALNVKAIKKYAGYTIARKSVKGVYYAWCYGAGALKLGRLMASPVNGSPEALAEFTRIRDQYRSYPQTNKETIWSSEMKKHRPATPEEAAWSIIGKKIKEAFKRGISGLSSLLNDLEETAKSYGYIRVLDRRLPVRSPHAVLNTLLQGAAAIVGKRWLTMTFDQCAQEGVDAHLLAYIHDEIQAEVAVEHQDRYAKLCVDCIAKAGEFYKFRIPLTGEAKRGRNWCETH